MHHTSYLSKVTQNEALEYGIPTMYWVRSQRGVLGWNRRCGMHDFGYFNDYQNLHIPT